MKSDTLRHVRNQIAMCEWQIDSCKGALPNLRNACKIKVAKATIRETSRELRGLKLDEAALVAGGRQ